MRQKDVADALNLAQTTIANYEQGIRFPDESTLHALADYLGVSLDYLMGRSTDFGAGAEPGNMAPAFNSGAELNDTARSYLHEIRAARVMEAEAVINRAVDGGMPVARVYMDVLQPVLREVGRLWETGELDVSEEHYISAATEGLMSRLMSTTSVSTGSRVFIGLAASGELHAIGIRMVTDVLSLRGWNSLFLGTNLPAPSVLKAIRDHRADIVGISVSMPYHVNPAANLIRTIRSNAPEKPVKILVGGLAFVQESHIWRTIDADGFAPDAEGAADLAQELIETRPD